MHPIQALEYITKHIAFKTVSGIAQGAGVDVSNLHACLAHKRTWSQGVLSRVACAVGLEVSQFEPELALNLAPQTVIHLNVSGDDLPVLADVLDAISAKRDRTLLMRVPIEAPSPGSVHALVIVHVCTSYVVLHVTWEAGEGAVQGIDQLPHVLTGVWLDEGNPDKLALSVSSSEWIRLRAGIENITALDRLFNVPRTPRIEEWAQMLLEVSKLGVSPESLTKMATLLTEKGRSS